jgi:hypothetical protein
MDKKFIAEKSSLLFVALGVLSIAFTSTGVTGNIVRNNSIPIDSGLFGFSLGILFIAISAIILAKNRN